MYHILTMFFRRALTIFHTVKYLKFKQVLFRIYYKFKKIAISDPPQLVDYNRWRWQGPALNCQSMFSANEVKFLSSTQILNNANFWNDESREKLWLYNLHYFDDLNSFNYEGREELHYYFIDKWISDNDNFSGNGWESYPISLRLVNWIKWFSKKGQVRTEHLKSIYIQADVLSKNLEYHILGNHLFANAKALVFVGAFIDCVDSGKFLKLGLKVLDSQIPEQFLLDGAHFELSPMYHGILLLDLLELIDLAKTTQNKHLLKRLPYWESTAVRALSWYRSMIHPDGEISFFNDAAFGIGIEPRYLFNYAKNLDLEGELTFSRLHTNRESGYSRVEFDLYTMLFDHAKIGPDYLPGHAHADSLSFELSIGKERVFVNSGTSIYGVSAERLRQRGTLAHNTVSVGGLNSSEVWSGFRVARRAKAKLLESNESKDRVTLSASHNGYYWIDKRILHTRKWICCKNRLELLDSLDAHHKAYFSLHVHPSVKLKQTGTNSIELTLDSGTVVVFTSSKVCSIVKGTWHPEFGKSIENRKIIVEFSGGDLHSSIEIRES